MEQPLYGTALVLRCRKKRVKKYNVGPNSLPGILITSVHVSKACHMTMSDISGMQCILYSSPGKNTGYSVTVQSITMTILKTISLTEILKLLVLLSPVGKPTSVIYSFCRLDPLKSSVNSASQIYCTWISVMK